MCEAGWTRQKTNDSRSRSRSNSAVNSSLPTYKHLHIYTHRINVQSQRYILMSLTTYPPLQFYKNSILHSLPYFKFYGCRTHMNVIKMPWIQRNKDQTITIDKKQQMQIKTLLKNNKITIFIGYVNNKNKKYLWDQNNKILSYKKKSIYIYIYL